MRVGGPAEHLVVASSTEEIVDAVRCADAEQGSPLLVMSGGSNLVVGDAGWPGVVVQVKSSGLELDGTVLTADAGLNWDDVVTGSLAAGLSGLEALSGIPGSVGATPVQNVGAFGTVTSDVLDSVYVYDRDSGALEWWDRERCGFGSHRQSAFKHTDRYVVLRVRYRLRQSTNSAPIEYESLAHRLGVPVGSTAPTADVRTAVLALRRQKGSVYDPDDADTWGTGSFFINPVLPEVPPAAARLNCPTYPDSLGVKLPAGWLIDHAGFAPGYGATWGRGSVRLSSKHALAVSNRGDATTAEVMAFARHIRAGVESAFGVRLGPECHLVNCSFDD